MIFHGITDLADVHFRFIILCFQITQLIPALFKQAEESLVFLCIKLPELCHYIRQQLSNLAHILGPDIAKCCLREICDLFLTPRTVLQYRLGIGQIDLSRKIIYHFLFFRCQFHLRNSLLLYQFLRLLLHDLCLCLRKGLQCKGRCLFCCCIQIHIHTYNPASPYSLMIFYLPSALLSCCHTLFSLTKSDSVSPSLANIVCNTCASADASKAASRNRLFSNVTNA